MSRVHGMFTPQVPESAEWTSALTMNLGFTPKLIHWYQDMLGPYNKFHKPSFDLVVARGAIPMVTLLPDDLIEKIAAGKKDAYFRQWARSAKKWNGTIFLRFAHEMNGNWYSWAGKPEVYVQAWKRMVDTFREIGATKVKFVWSPNVDILEDPTTEPFDAYYPGAEYVNYLALDGYNWVDPARGGNRTFAQVFGGSYERLIRMGNQPVIIAETACAGSEAQKAAWIRDMAKAIPQGFSSIAYVVWFNENKEKDWRLTNSPEVLRAYTEMVRG